MKKYIFLFTTLLTTNPAVTTCMQQTPLQPQAIPATKTKAPFYAQKPFLTWSACAAASIATTAATHIFHCPWHIKTVAWLVSAATLISLPVVLKSSTPARANTTDSLEQPDSVEQSASIKIKQIPDHDVFRIQDTQFLYDALTALTQPNTEGETIHAWEARNQEQLKDLRTEIVRLGNANQLENWDQKIKQLDQKLALLSTLRKDPVHTQLFDSTFDKYSMWDLLIIPTYLGLKPATFTEASDKQQASRLLLKEIQTKDASSPIIESLFPTSSDTSDAATQSFFCNPQSLIPLDWIVHQYMDQKDNPFAPQKDRLTPEMTHITEYNSFIQAPHPTKSSILAPNIDVRSDSFVLGMQPFIFSFPDLRSSAQLGIWSKNCIEHIHLFRNALFPGITYLGDCTQYAQLQSYLFEYCYRKFFGIKTFLIHMTGKLLGTIWFFDRMMPLSLTTHKHREEFNRFKAWITQTSSPIAQIDPSITIVEDTNSPKPHLQLAHLLFEQNTTFREQTCKLAKQENTQECLTILKNILGHIIHPLPLETSSLATNSPATSNACTNSAYTSV